MTQITETQVNKLIATIDKGLTFGLGEPIPGNMCIQAAVCYATGEHHKDTPICVNKILRDFGVVLNDQSWGLETIAFGDTEKSIKEANKRRAEGMKRYAIAQLGNIPKMQNWESTYAYEHRISEAVTRNVKEELKKLPGINIGWGDTYAAVISTLSQNKREREVEILEAACRGAVNACIELNTEGSQWLHKFDSAENPEKFIKKQKKVAKKQNKAFKKTIKEWETRYSHDRKEEVTQ